MDRPSIQRLAASTLEAPLFKELAAHGEELIVERKARIPEPEQLAAEVASMANTIGGWILLGVDDRTRELRALEQKRGLDLQSHIGHLLRGNADPVPPFLAAPLDVDGTAVGFIRVFPVAGLVLVTGAGAVYVRDAGGKVPVNNYRELVDLIARGRDAEDEARTRAIGTEFCRRAVGLPVSRAPIDVNHIRTVITAAPLTVTPQLAEWPISSDGPKHVRAGAEWLAASVYGGDFSVVVEPYGRAVAIRAAPLEPPPARNTLYAAIGYADCAGVFAASASRGAPNVLPSDEFRRNHIRPALEVVSGLLTKAEAYGDALLEMYIWTARENMIEKLEHKLQRETHCGSAILTVPADEDDLSELAQRWEREVARSAGLEMWEAPAGE